MNDGELRGRMPITYRRVMNFIEDLPSFILREQLDFQASWYHSSTAIALDQTIELPRTPICEGEIWGHEWDSGYFRLKATVPESWHGKALAAWLDFGGEGLIYSPEGLPLFGITSGSAFAERYSKDIYRLNPACQGGEAIELYIETAANGLAGIKEAPRTVKRKDPKRHGSWEAKVNRIRLCTIDETVWHLYLDMRFLMQLWEDLDRQSVQAARILRALMAAATAWQGNPLRAPECRALLAGELAKPAHASALSTTVVGHAHIDTAWLWRLDETHRKVARTFASQLDLIQRYPGYVFGASAPVHHAWIKAEHPELYAKIKAAVQAGTWEVQGAMWVEADCNLLSGESLVRQILHGKNFWMDEFGLDVRNCWIPDVFGYSASLPQMLRRAGVETFVTQKMSWSKHNEFPHDTFRWRGIDGSEVLTHFPPEHTYNSFCTPNVLRRAERTFHEKAFLDEFITLMGLGDGGGGAKEEHLEHARRAANLESVPKATLGRADAILGRLLEHADELEVWVGELYLEYHRGTFTTQGHTKLNNRRLEQEIRLVEALWCLLPLSDYPRSELDGVVKTLLLHQFHDIIPGSSIHQVYVDADEAYAQAFSTLDKLKRRAATALGLASPAGLALFNCLSHPWSGVLALPADFAADSLVDGAGGEWPVQWEAAGPVVSLEIPAQTLAQFRPGTPRPARATTPRTGGDGPQAATGDKLLLENDLVSYRFDGQGCLVEAFDKRFQRPILKAGAKGNQFAYYEDTPHNYEAWDIDFYYRDQLLAHPSAMDCQRLPAGPVRQGLHFELTVGNSRISQDIFLETGSAALHFQTKVGWNEERRMLRVAFPLDSLAQDAACDIPYGFVRRPTHANTEWDFARFEVCAQRYIDISDAQYGVALLNDCKYGHSVLDNVLDLCLLRSPMYPDPDADQGDHQFTYVLYPHGGDLVQSDLIEKAAMLNRPPLLLAGGTGDRQLPIRLYGQGVSMEAVKKAEKQEALIVRLVETRGMKATIQLAGNGRGAFIQETDLLEWHDQTAQSLDSPVTFNLNPFEIRTFKVSYGRNPAP